MERIGVMNWNVRRHNLREVGALAREWFSSHGYPPGTVASVLGVDEQQGQEQQWYLLVNVDWQMFLDQHVECAMVSL